MPALDLTFNSPINISCKVGDTAYYVNTTTMGGHSVAGETYLIGTINSITTSGSSIILNVEMESDYAEFVTESSFIFFSKNNLVETGSILGYFAKAKFRNNSTNKAELHATAFEIEQSSD
mgnify:CR=1 FL=1|tara:strand:- start:400 stop:759 length:360 start_codon:yes stop_codon:yes gene_type:complete